MSPEHRLYVPPPVRPSSDETADMSHMLSGILSGLRLHDVDIHSPAWHMRKLVEEARYANLKDDFSKAMGSRLRQEYEEGLRRLDEESEDETKQDAASKSDRSSMRRVFNERLADDLEGTPFLRPPDTLDQTLEARHPTKPPPSLGAAVNRPRAVEDNFYSLPNEDFVSSGAYETLNPELHQFRLVRLLPGRWDEDIQCELTGPRPISEAKYDALSYSAGDVKDVRGIFVNGIRFWVFNSLFRALWQVRISTALSPGLLLWIDQICINQHDPYEKAQQVLFMRHIYNHALKTLVWIGEQDDNSLGIMYAMELAKRHQEHMVTEMMRMPTPNEQGFSTRLAKHSILHTAALKLTAVWLVDQILDDSISMLPLAALLDIFEASWWRRCWVVQELVVSRSALVVWGRANETWFNFKTVPHVLQFASKLLHHEIRMKNPAVKPVHARFALSMYNQSANDMRILRAAWKFSQGIELRHALSIARDLKSTDPRDRVFSFLGLVKQDYGITPDYRPSTKPDQVFHEAAVKSILVDHSLDILCDREPRSSQTDASLPSWVPDFSRPLSRRGFVDWHFQQEFRASANLEPEFRLRPSANGQPNRVLRLKAIVLHPGLKTSDDFNTIDRSKLLINTILESIRDSQSDNTDTFNGVGIDLLQTLLFGLDGDGVRVFLESLLSQILGSRISKSFNTEKQDDGKVDLSDGEKRFQEIDEKLIFEDAYHRFTETFLNSEPHWRLLTTDKFHALVPRETEAGDLLCVAPGVAAPLVFRYLPTKDTDGNNSTEAFWLIGPAYVHGYMHGRAVEEYQHKKLEERWIDVV